MSVPQDVTSDPGWWKVNPVFEYFRVYDLYDNVEILREAESTWVVFTTVEGEHRDPQDFAFEYLTPNEAQEAKRQIEKYARTIYYEKDLVRYGPHYDRGPNRKEDR